MTSRERVGEAQGTALRIGPGAGSTAFAVLPRGTPLRWTGDRVGDFVFVQPLEPEKGAPQGEAGWVSAGDIGMGRTGAAGWPEGQNARTARVVQRYFSEGLRGRGPHHCALALRLELGINEGMGDAHVAWRSYLQRGWTVREGNVQPGDLVFYVPGQSSSYTSQPEGHVGIAMMDQGQMRLLSHITGRDGVGRWRIMPIGDPTYALCQ